MFTLIWMMVASLNNVLFLVDFQMRQHLQNGGMRNGPGNAGTALSHYTWHLKDNNIQFNTKWSILSKANTFNPTTKKCRLCLKEVYYILYKPETASLNSRNEVFGWCKHRKQWALKYTQDQKKLFSNWYYSCF